MYFLYSHPIKLKRYIEYSDFFFNNASYIKQKEAL